MHVCFCCCSFLSLCTLKLIWLTFPAIVAEKLKSTAKTTNTTAEVIEEFEDDQGNVFNKKTYEGIFYPSLYSESAHLYSYILSLYCVYVDLKRQGII